MTTPAASIDVEQQESANCPIAASTAPVAADRVRIAEIDALRGLAALAVVLFHFTTRLAESDQTIYKRLWFEFPYGLEAVYLFFMISGFVILMTAERVRSVLDFVVARIARLYPAYWGAVAVSFVLIHATPFLPDRPTSLSDAALNLTMIQYIWGIGNLDGSFWSLYVELLFYAVVALLIAARRLPWLCGSMLSLAVITSLVMYTPLRDAVPGVWRLPLVFPLARYAHYFCFGIWVYRLRTGWNWWFVPSVICLGICAASHGQFAAAAINGSVFGAAAGGWLPWLNNRLFVFLGAISYSLYLFHQNLGWTIIRWAGGFGVDSNIAVPLAVAVAILVASIARAGIEKPANEVIRNWWRRRRDVLCNPADGLTANASP